MKFLSRLLPRIAQGKVLAPLILSAAVLCAFALLLPTGLAASFLGAIGIVLLAAALVGSLYQSRKATAELRTLVKRVNLQTVKTPDIAGSVSRLRAKQESMSNLAAELRTQNQKLLSKLADLELVLAQPQSASDDDLRARELLEAREQDLLEREQAVVLKEIALAESSDGDRHRDEVGSKLWQLERSLVLPYAVDRDQYSVVRKPKEGQQWLRNLKVAAILDEFSFLSIAPEVELHPVTPDNWREVIDRVQPDLFLCESAWRGFPTAEQPWKGRIYASSNFNYENRGDLKQLLEHCRKKGIPTAFWNKEDPTHFGDPINDFVATASLFDQIFTTAVELILEYTKLTGHENVHVLPFGAQPRLFFPPTDPHEEDRAIFAGSWYKAHPERSATQRQLFAAVENAGVELVIYDRHSQGDSEYFGYPPEYSSKVRPAVPFEKTAELYRQYPFGISVNTSTSSQTMLARRAFEMIACGCGVVTNRTPATDAFFGSSIIALNPDDSIERGALENLRHTRVDAMNKVLRDHSYEARLLKAFNELGFDLVGHSDKATLVARVETVQEAERALAAFNRVKSVAEDLVLLVKHSVPSHQIQEFYAFGVNSKCRVVSETLFVNDELDEKTIFTRPFVFTTENFDDLDAELISRALSHAVYSREPVAPRRLAAMPEYGISPLTAGAVVPAVDLRFYAKKHFTPELVLHV